MKIDYFGIATCYSIICTSIFLAWNYLAPMLTFAELTEAFKIAKLLKDGGNTSKEAKMKLNEIVTLVNAYALTILKETCKGREITEEDVKKVFKTLETQ